MKLQGWWTVGVGLALALGCAEDATPRPDGGPVDGGDGSTDGGFVDGGGFDGGGADGGSLDGASMDGGPEDGGSPDGCQAFPELGAEARVELPAGAADPEGVRIGPDCALYVASGRVAYRIAVDGTITEHIVEAGFSRVEGLLFTEDALYAASREANAVWRFHRTTGAFLGVFAETAEGSFDGPNSVALGPDGDIFVSSRNTNAVVRFGPDGAFRGEFVPPPSDPAVESPEGIAFGPSGDLYVSWRTGSAVTRFDGATGALVETVLDDSEVDAPEGLGFDSNGRLWVASRNLSEVLVLTPDRWEIERRLAIPMGRPVGLEIRADGKVYVGTRDPAAVWLLE